MTSGYAYGDKSPLAALAYAPFQELAPRVPHRNTPRATGDPLADKLLARIAPAEKLHLVFYRNLMAAAFDIDPDLAMQAVTTEVVGFEMPGATMAGFRRMSMLIAKAGIYDLRLHHDEVVSPVLRAWRVFERTDLGPAGEKAREELAEFLAGLDAQATRFVESRERARARVAARQG